VITSEAIERTELWLPEHSDLTPRIYEDLGHNVSPAEIADVNEFLRSTF
jgi:phospholipase/carboxylesterase